MQENPFQKRSGLIVKPLLDRIFVPLPCFSCLCKRKFDAFFKILFVNCEADVVGNVVRWWVGGQIAKYVGGEQVQ